MGKWTQSEIEQLEEIYPYFMIDELESVFPERTRHSINDKAKQMNLTKATGVRKARSIADTEKIDMMSIESNFANFICGLIAAEGHFSRYYREKRERYVFSFSLKLVSDNQDILRDFKDVMNTGGVYRLESKKSTERPTVTYDIVSIGGLYNRIIPLIDEYGLKNSRKQSQYED